MLLHVLLVTGAKSILYLCGGQGSVKAVLSTYRLMSVSMCHGQGSVNSVLSTWIIFKCQPYVCFNVSS